jgi:hypothetical protein
VLELYVMQGLAANSCFKCHDVQGVPEAVYTRSLQRAATQPSTVIPMLLATVPTGIPQTPRRWFAHSTFDHRAHRNMSCVSCHVNAPQSVATSDVLSPDIEWKAGGKNVSCMDCHHSPQSDAAGAGSNCVTCHVFHDRRLERPADGRFDVTEAVRGVVGPATQPASAAAPQSQPGA